MTQEKEVVYVSARKPGFVAGVIAVIAAILAFFSFALLFLPIAVIAAAIGTPIAIKNRNGAAIGINVFAWALILAAMAVSPSIWAIFGASAL